MVTDQKKTLIRLQPLEARVEPLERGASSLLCRLDELHNQRLLLGLALQ